MRLLADLIKDKGSEWNEALVEMLAAQVVAVAAYNGERLNDMDIIKRYIYKVAGYPMLNTFSQDARDNVDRATAKRVAALVGVRLPAPDEL